MKNKKGVSQIIATVLLISLAVILSLIVLFWAKGFFSEQIEKNGKNIDLVCKEAKIEVLYEKGVAGVVKMRIKNEGSISIGAVEIKEEGNVNIQPKIFNISLNPGLVSSEIIYLIEDYNNLRLLRIYPSLLGEVRGKKVNKFSACLTNSKVIKRENLL